MIDRTRILQLVFVLAVSLTAGAGLWIGCASSAPPTRDRPNILLVVADDLGYSDPGAYGSEIDTPNLDELAHEGLIASDFYVAPRGAPTRAMLLTGVDHHRAGFGTVPEHMTDSQRNRPGYEGHLNDRVVSVATLLQAAGYHTYMAGKWELGKEPDQRPAAHGFEQSLALLPGAASHWGDMLSVRPPAERALYSRNGELIESVPPDWYSARSFTDALIEQIESGRADGRPFFAYLAFQTPHGPLAAPDEWRDRCAGRYVAGFDTLRERRLLRMKRLELVRHDVVPFPGLPTIPPWTALSKEQQQRQIRRMELYCAMVEHLDHQLGRVLAHLKQIGEYDDTVILFLSDNGAAADDRGPTGRDFQNRAFLTRQFPEATPERWGQPGSFVEYGAAWAQVSTVPLRLFKGTVGEGGIRVPFIASGWGIPRHKKPNPAVLHVTDLFPTLLELADTERPPSFQGNELAPLEGRSLVRLLSGNASAVRDDEDWIGFELDGARALRQNHWKLAFMERPVGTGQWSLYRLDRDPSELFDLAKKRRGRLASLVALWAEYARTRGVVAPSETQDLLD